MSNKMQAAELREDLEAQFERIAASSKPNYEKNQQLLRLLFSVVLDSRGMLFEAREEIKALKIQNFSR